MTLPTTQSIVFLVWAGGTVACLPYAVKTARGMFKEPCECYGPDWHSMRAIVGKGNALVVAIMVIVTPGICALWPVIGIDSLWKKWKNRNAPKCGKCKMVLGEDGYAKR